ncbi:OPA family glycerol-3-phosphate transporter-like MFS transporter [Laceyella sacchari]|jgi:MFS transporter, OPA family, glycerol-3-phosphate transporter|uniref:glycerol-3-phosphate transporter n=1 Tax=Laceyella sacchari TaxID=37482 RepID=UPI0010437452|nr:glycerol-3-phosphate transporter [Laceyella sacchari]TCW39027.1 OPA family glycerol-3-phosphate transporter-like MFS transporter [Laceyella sacchari]
MNWLLTLFKPAPHIERLPADKIDSTYRRLRLQVFLGIFIGYAGYYLVRKNFSLAIPDLVREGFSKGELGLVLSAISIAYGISKFLMGIVSDRSNPRYFLATGLILSALINMAFGLIPAITSSITVMFVLMFLNGWAQGMGWPPSGKTVVHWFSISERGTKMSLWNIAHNIGGGLVAPLMTLGIAIFATWKSVFFFPAMIALVIALFILLTVRDTPQSVGLPPIEEYKNDYPQGSENEDYDKDLTMKEILFKYVLNNKFLWYIALANIFVYFVRYGVIDWAPTYLTEAKGFSPEGSRWAYFLYEYAGIPGMLLSGWMSDKLFKGRRAPASVIFMAGVLIAVLIYWLNPAGNPLLDNIALVAIGFLIYGPVMMIGLHALDLVPKKAAGTAAGLTGFFGYLFGTAFASAIVGYVVDGFGWDGMFTLLIASCVLAIFFLALTWNTGKSEQKTV